MSNLPLENGLFCQGEVLASPEFSPFDPVLFRDAEKEFADPSGTPIFIAETNRMGKSSESLTEIIGCFNDVLAAAKVDTDKWYTPGETEVSMNGQPIQLGRTAMELGSGSVDTVTWEDGQAEVRFSWLHGSLGATVLSLAHEGVADYTDLYGWDCYPEQEIPASNQSTVRITILVDDGKKLAIVADSTMGYSPHAGNTAPVDMDTDKPEASAFTETISARGLRLIEPESTVVTFSVEPAPAEFQEK